MLVPASSKCGLVRDRDKTVLSAFKTAIQIAAEFGQDAAQCWRIEAAREVAVLASWVRVAGDQPDMWMLPTGLYFAEGRALEVCPWYRDDGPYRDVRITSASAPGFEARRCYTDRVLRRMSVGDLLTEARRSEDEEILISIGPRMSGRLRQQEDRAEIELRRAVESVKALIHLHDQNRPFTWGLPEDDLLAELRESVRIVFKESHARKAQRKAWEASIQEEMVRLKEEKRATLRTWFFESKVLLQYPSDFLSATELMRLMKDVFGFESLETASTEQLNAALWRYRDDEGEDLDAAIRNWIRCWGPTRPVCERVKMEES